MAFRVVVIVFGGDGKMDRLAVNGTLYDAPGKGNPTNGETPQPVLWGDSSTVEFVEGSNCVVIGGRKYCG